MATPAYLANNDADLIRLIKDGAVFIRPAGTTDIPTGLTWAPTGTDSQLGYYSEDGYTLTPKPGDSTDFTAHNGDIVLSEQDDGYWELKLSGLEDKTVVTCAYFDIDPADIGTDGSITVTKASNSKRYDLVLAGFDQKQQLIIAHLPNAQISDRDEMKFNKSTLLAKGMTFRTFKGASAAPYHLKAWGMALDHSTGTGGQ